MADDYARSIARVVVGQLAEQAGYESAHETAIDVLSELLLRYLEELSAGSHAYAELATRSEINAYDALMAIEDTGGTTVDDLTKYIGSLSSEENAFAHTLAPFPVRRPARSMPTFEERGEPPPPHIPSFLPAFPDPHTYERTPVFAGHEENPEKQTQTVKQQRRVAERALVQLHKRAKAAADGAEAETTVAGVVAGGEASASGVPAAAAAAAAAGDNPFLLPPTLVEELPTRSDARLPIGGGGRQQLAAAAAAVRGDVPRDPAESAFQTLLSAEGEPAWTCGFNFENGGGALKPTFDAGFSGDWATATHRAALAASSRLPQEDAYRFDANKAGKS